MKTAFALVAICALMASAATGASAAGLRGRGMQGDLNAGRTKVAFGNNGSVSCAEYCSNGWNDQVPKGSGCVLGHLVGGPKSGQALACNATPGTGNALQCKCRLADVTTVGNNGSASCDAYCAAGSNGEAAVGSTCTGAANTKKLQLGVTCATVGLADGLTCGCAAPTNIKKTVGNNGSQSCANYCSNGWNNEVPKGSGCAGAHLLSNGAGVGCAAVPGETVTCSCVLAKVTTVANNGSMKCSEYCRKGWNNEAPIGSHCIGAAATSRLSPGTTCDSVGVPGGLTCGCMPPANLVDAHGNNGSVSCSEYCSNGWNNQVPKGSGCAGGVVNGRGVGCAGSGGRPVTCQCTIADHYTQFDNGSMSCRDYCAKGWNNEAPKGSTCVAAARTSAVALGTTCDSVGVPGGLTCGCGPVNRWGSIAAAGGAPAGFVSGCCEETKKYGDCSATLKMCLDFGARTGIAGTVFPPAATLTVDPKITLTVSAQCDKAFSVSESRAKLIFQDGLTQAKALVGYSLGFDAGLQGSVTVALDSDFSVAVGAGGVRGSGSVAAPTLSGTLSAAAHVKTDLYVGVETSVLSVVSAGAKASATASAALSAGTANGVKASTGFGASVTVNGAIQAPSFELPNPDICGHDIGFGLGFKLPGWSASETVWSTGAGAKWAS